MRPLLSALVLVLAVSAASYAQQPPPPGAALPSVQAPPPGGELPPPPPPNAPPPMYPMAELERVVSPVALYPDPLLAQVLAAATYPQDIIPAAQWSDQHHYLNGPTLASAIQADQLPWDPSVQALLPFPSVLDMMARSMPWTQELGAAFLAQQQDVMNAVQAQRARAAQFGYLQSNAQVVVTRGPFIAITPVNPAYVVVPYYDPAVVYLAPRPGFRLVTAIRFGYGVNLGVAFQPWGWGYSRVDWGARVVYINHDPWRRTWVNRVTYVHPYEVRRVAPAAVAVPRREEQHRAIERSEQERAAEREGRKRAEDHKREEDRKKKDGRGGV